MKRNELFFFTPRLFINFSPLSHQFLNKRLELFSLKKWQWSIEKIRKKEQSHISMAISISFRKRCHMALNINVIEREMEDKEITLDTVLNI